MKTQRFISQIASMILLCSLSFISFAAATAYPSAPESPTLQQGKQIKATITTIKSVPEVTSTPTAQKAKPEEAKASQTQQLIVAKVVWVKGNLKAMTPDMKSRTLVKADPIYLHDTLTTDASTQAQIVFTDDSLMTFRPDSKFYIENYAFDKTKAQQGSVGKYIMNLIKGGFRTITGIIAKANPSDYKVNTPVATIGVRGTDYAVSLQDGELFMSYYQGSPCVTGGSQTMCLDKDHLYAKVPRVNAPPVALRQQPAVFREKMPITNTTFSSTPTNTPTPTTSTTPTSTSTITNTLTPTNITLPQQDIEGVISNFCIQ